MAPVRRCGFHSFRNDSETYNFTNENEMKRREREINERIVWVLGFVFAFFGSKRANSKSKKFALFTTVVKIPYKFSAFVWVHRFRWGVQLVRHSVQTRKINKKNCFIQVNNVVIGWRPISLKFARCPTQRHSITGSWARTARQLMVQSLLNDECLGRYKVKRRSRQNKERS